MQHQHSDFTSRKKFGRLQLFGWQCLSLLIFISADKIHAREIFNQTFLTNKNIALKQGSPPLSERMKLTYQTAELAMQQRDYVKAQEAYSLLMKMHVENFI